LILLPGKALFTAAAAAKTTRCVIKQDGVVADSGACHFQRAEGGSFSINRHDGDTNLHIITDLSVSIVSTGNAEVYGLTTTGINSRWGGGLP